MHTWGRTSTGTTWPAVPIYGSTSDMFLTEEENRKLTEVGPGTPGGELLRRYWHPIVGLHQVTEEAPTAHIRILGEDLVLFRDKAGRVVLLADHCPHRAASLLYVCVEER